MLKILKPHLFLRTIYELDFGRLSRRGIHGLIVDLDNTLVGYNRPDASEQLRSWLARAKQLGFDVCIVSNNLTARVEAFARVIGVKSVSNAAKPRRRGFSLAMSKMGTQPATTAVIGDQVFTDILGGNRLGLYTILVHPVDPHEFLTTRLVRRVERLVVHRPEIGTADSEHRSKRV